MLVVFVLRLESIYSEELTMTLEARSRAFFQEYVTFVGLAKRLNDFWTKQKHTLKEVDHLLRGHKGYGAYMFTQKRSCALGADSTADAKQHRRSSDSKVVQAQPAAEWCGEASEKVWKLFSDNFPQVLEHEVRGLLKQDFTDSDDLPRGVTPTTERPQHTPQPTTPVARESGKMNVGGDPSGNGVERRSYNSPQTETLLK